MTSNYSEAQLPRKEKHAKAALQVLSLQCDLCESIIANESKDYCVFRPQGPKEMVVSIENLEAINLRTFFSSLKDAPLLVPIINVYNWFKAHIFHPSQDFISGFLYPFQPALYLPSNDMVWEKESKESEKVMDEEWKERKKEKNKKKNVIL